MGFGKVAMNIAVTADTGAAFDVVSPVDGHVYARRNHASAGAIEAALACAETAAKGWARLPIAERIAVVTRFGEEMAKRAPLLAEATVWQMGRPLWQADETPRLKLVGDLLAQAAEALADEEF